MPTYEYQCTACGLRFERRQAITEAPVTECLDCRGGVRRAAEAGNDRVPCPRTDRSGDAGVGRGCSTRLKGRASAPPDSP